MEHMYENQQPDELDVYQACIHHIAKSFYTPAETAEEIRQFGINFSKQTPEDREAIGFLMNGMIAATPEIVEIDDPRLVSNAFIQGAVSGLYVGNTMLGGYVPTKDIFATSQNMLEDGPREFHGRVLELIGHMSPETRQILDSWRVSLGSEAMHGLFFELGFGATMVSVNKKIYEIDMLLELENATEWSKLDYETNSEFTPIPVDDDCLMLAQAFQAHVETIQLDQLPANERRDALQEVAKLLMTDVFRAKELKLEDVVQTRGIGACVGYNEEDEPEDMYEYGEAFKIRGRMARVDCMSVPTEFEILMGARDEAYEPQVCLVLDNVELIEPNGDISAHKSCVAIPLRVSGTTQLDKIIYPTDQS